MISPVVFYLVVKSSAGSAADRDYLDVSELAAALPENCPLRKFRFAQMLQKISTPPGIR
jgi:hypothetical protein